MNIPRILCIYVLLMSLCIFLRAEALTKPPETVRGLYLNPASLYPKRVTEVIHYAPQAGLTVVVLHVKDPFGHLHWKSQNPTALAIGAVKGTGQVEAAIARFRAAGIWVIAKQDCFQDSALAAAHPEWAVMDSDTKSPWKNKDDLLWTNPYDAEVWNYLIALSKELLALGVNEIQYDYVRFPSDGKLARITYPKVQDKLSKVETIGAFLKTAHEALQPLGATLSVDLFGMVAWKTDDFGVGQRIENIAPNVDAICPMLYPSHFPKGFLGKESPAKFPDVIMQESMERLAKRTDVAVRPWIQGFWYTPAEINAQFDGIERAKGVHWLIWNPASDYERSYQALEQRLKKTFTPIETAPPPPPTYPVLAELEKLPPRLVQGRIHPVQFTDYLKGYSLLTLESGSPYNTPAGLLMTLDEAVMDAVLEARRETSLRGCSRSAKASGLVRLLCADLATAPTRMQVRPIYLDWKNGARFTTVIPSGITFPAPAPSQP